MTFINSAAFEAACTTFAGQHPFDHCVIDDFFLPEVAVALATEFPEFDDPCWHVYNNQIEIKKTCNSWNQFPPLTYRVFEYLSSDDFVAQLSRQLGIADLTADPGLNGGGWHLHKAGGRLNPHLDYNIHPKLQRQRRLNIIVYLSENWQPAWGGQLGFWTQDPEARRPGAMVKAINPLFNRAVLFDTTQNSWHGLAGLLSCPHDHSRNSLAVYYLTPAPADAEVRGKALFAPTADQQGDREVIELIRKRSQTELAAGVYDRDRQ